MKAGYVINDQQKTLFITCTVVDWIDVFSRKTYPINVATRKDSCGSGVGGFYRTFARLPNISSLMEYRAYKYVYDWTGNKAPYQDSFKSEMGYTPKFLLNYGF